MLPQTFTNNLNGTFFFCIAFCFDVAQSQSNIQLFRIDYFVANNFIKSTHMARQTELFLFVRF